MCIKTYKKKLYANFFQPLEIFLCVLYNYLMKVSVRDTMGGADR